mgnify:CR=1 FL=1
MLKIIIIMFLISGCSVTSWHLETCQQPESLKVKALILF